MKKEKNIKNEISPNEQSIRSKASLEKNKLHPLKNDNQEKDFKDLKEEITSILSQNNLNFSKKEINILAIDPRESYVADLGYFIKMFIEEMKDEGIDIKSYKFRRPEDLKMERKPILYDIFILNFRVGPTGFTENEIKALREKKISAVNKPIFLLFVPTAEMKWELRHYSPIGDIIDMYLEITSSYCYGDTCLREALIMILKENKILKANYSIKEEKRTNLYGTYEQEAERIEKEIVGGKITSEMEEDGEQIPEEEFVT